MGYSEGERTLLKGNLMSSNPLARYRWHCPKVSSAWAGSGLNPSDNQSGGAV